MQLIEWLIKQEAELDFTSVYKHRLEILLAWPGLAWWWCVVGNSNEEIIIYEVGGLGGGGRGGGGGFCLNRAVAVSSLSLCTSLWKLLLYFV